MHGLLLAATLLSLPFNAVAHVPPTTGLVRRGVDLDSFRLNERSQFKISEQVEKDSGVSALHSRNYVDVATRLVKRVAPKATFRLVDDHYIGDTGVGHVYFRQTINGVDVDNGDFNVNIGRNGRVFSYGNSFHTGDVPESNLRVKEDPSNPVQALHGALKALRIPIKAERAVAEATNEEDDEDFVLKGTSGALADPTAKLVYLMKNDGSLALTWRVETDIGDNWLLTYVDAEDTTKVHNVVDYVAHATYKVYRWGIADPTEGELEVISDPWNLRTSEFTWHGNGTTRFSTTIGNNGIAQSNPTGGSEYLNNYRPQPADLKFEYDYSPSMNPPSTYIDASITQLWYSANTYHDLLYMLGFNERSGNFETNNNNQGGKGNDYVILNAQDGSGTNNANFATPPDGRPGRMRMYIWTRANPPRDVCFEEGTVVHEYTHGLSNRLTGGPANSRCLNALESGGMGEGWSDFFATAVRLKPKDTRHTDYPKGAWVANNPRGVRQYVYSTNMTTNPLVYTTVNSLNQVHAIGTVWATILYEVLWNLIDKHGKNDGPTPKFRNGVPTDGKYLAMKLVLDGLALQPCNPNFVQARDAILDADKILTGGRNQCELWKGFAKRELGTGAKWDPRNRVGSTRVPVICRIFT
ncbi:extracellular elastinolytic metalloproteinase [Uncinocarpus reesii 1704]|uniref:Extracellular metalloproteinase 10 n=1 Tax=Uncinocarpus reesii (strain UAMH 1704) TaxID=336963 RepID=MEP10_UNCRE|nr:extracellular elastinolytic metalloproteinase [Uncinocarpus reesii 1704]C4JX59.1 RecName: Full=Extracellular metalloproteinase 10; AltName: Full=Elastinolytic metalloproteinase MEP10; AltName: Full=Fungalysin MEP10; Flags: Precursor [Uncinocarpus reesii 1704]EEP81367.1 extracellular elastinolytic metalloproteinase [Uncinocarpus reesii 1704]